MFEFGHFVQGNKDEIFFRSLGNEPKVVLVDSTFLPKFVLSALGVLAFFVGKVEKTAFAIAIYFRCERRHAQLAIASLAMVPVAWA